jgi:hypothetical protein
MSRGIIASSEYFRKDLLPLSEIANKKSLTGQQPLQPMASETTGPLVPGVIEVAGKLCPQPRSLLDVKAKSKSGFSLQTEWELSL